MGEVSYSLREVADYLTEVSSFNVSIKGDEEVTVSGLGALGTARKGDLTHLSKPGFKPLLFKTLASAVILKPADANDCSTNALLVSNPYLAFALASHLFDEKPRVPVGVHENASIDPTVQLGADVRIGPFVCVEAGSIIGDRVEIGAGSFIGSESVVEADTVIMPRVVINYRTSIGSRCTIHSGSVIGADGFGFTPTESGALQGIAQIGGVSIGCNVRIGAGTTIDRGAIEDTVIEDGVKIDNLVQIGHNCHIKAHTLICGCVGIVGSTVVGKHCLIAGGVGIGGDVRTPPISIVDFVTVSGMTHVSRSIKEPGVYSGGVLHSKSSAWKRNALRFRNLDSMAKQLNRIEAKLRI